MAEQQVESLDALAFQLQTQLADAGSGIEYDDVRPASNLDASGIAAAT
jgi:hypothetical protein